jgi:hypothetical protein
MIFMANVGVINEQGDMGLGYDPLSERDEKTLHESESQEKEKSTAE